MIIRKFVASLAFFGLGLLSAPVLVAAPAQDGASNPSVLATSETTRQYGQEFNGKIAKTYEDSTEWWPKAKVPPGGTPNVLVINLDDVGFGHLGAFGGVIETPNIDALAAGGLRYTNFHSTALCTPSRAALLAGRNHHRIGMGGHSLTAMGFPGYNALIPASAKSVASHLQQAGFVNYALGKWDGAPAHEVSTSGPFDRWPSGQGFQHFYGFMAAETDNFHPVLFKENASFEVPATNRQYHLSEDLADQAITYITSHVSVSSNRPFFMYWAPGAMHGPHHAPKAFIAHYKGKFDGGWDQLREFVYERQRKLGILPAGTKLTARPTELPAWGSLGADERKLYARQMEVFAAMLTHLDIQVGRMIDTLRRVGELDNTIIFVTSDNGASAEGGLGGTHNESYFINGIHTPFDVNMAKYDEWGGPETYPHYHAGWAWAGNTPFKYYKQLVHNGGVQVPLIVRWPDGIKARGEIRAQYHHVIDIMPTILEVSNTKFNEVVSGVEQLSLDGKSMAYSFADKSAPTVRTEQYYELWGNRGIYQDGWKAVAAHGEPAPWEMASQTVFDHDEWELYHVAEDFSEAVDLAGKYPRKLAELKERWEVLAWENNVFPLYDDVVDRISAQQQRLHGERKVFTYYAPGAVRIAEFVAPPVKKHSHTIRTTLDLEGSEEGVIVASGGRTGGYSLFIKDRHLFYDYNAYGDEHYILKSQALPVGKIDIEFKMQQNDPRSGVGGLYVNGKMVDQTPMTNLHTTAFNLAETFDVGMDLGTPVSTHYGAERHFPYTGKLDKVIIILE
jgi:arylsulfatase A-like enzyme